MENNCVVKKEIDRSKLIHILDKLNDQEVMYLVTIGQTILMEKNILCGKDK